MPGQCIAPRPPLLILSDPGRLKKIRSSLYSVFDRCNLSSYLFSRVSFHISGLSPCNATTLDVCRLFLNAIAAPDAVDSGYSSGCVCLYSDSHKCVCYCDYKSSLCTRYHSSVRAHGMCSVCILLIIDRLLLFFWVDERVLRRLLYALCFYACRTIRYFRLTSRLQ